jgi:hypothetical protein
VRFVVYTYLTEIVSIGSPRRAKAICDSNNTYLQRKTDDLFSLETPVCVQVFAGAADFLLPAC